MLAYDRVIGMIKAGDYMHAARHSLNDPRIWPLLTRPLKARIRRLGTLASSPRIAPAT
jgi:hypothetical protein